MLGYGIMGSPSIVEPLPPPYKSNWLWIHVSFAWICYGAFHVSAALGALYLLKGRFAGRAGRVFGLLESLPEPAKLDDINFKLIVYGFIAHVVMLGSGAIWAYGLWGRYWAWDPIETWSLISWVIYGICIHLRMSYGWRGKRFAWLSIIAVIAILVTFGGIGFIGGTHTPLLQ
jgi:ABC-type transport system involved in cytochrome c biogenesis permease subunit